MDQENTQAEKEASGMLPPYERVREKLRSIGDRAGTRNCDYLRLPFRHSALRSFLTMETLPLKPQACDPVPIEAGKRLICQLFAIASRDKSLHPPWLVAVWEWPDMDLVRVEKLGYLSPLGSQPLSPDCLINLSYHEAFCNALNQEGPWPELPRSLSDLYASLSNARGPTAQFVSEIPARDLSKLNPADQTRSFVSAPVVPEFKTLDRECVTLAQTARELSLPRALARILDARKLCSRSGFCVAICGEFSRGKSSLANALLGRILMPTGALPTTRFFARISHANEERMVWHEKGHAPLQLPATPEAWSELTARLARNTRGVMHLECPSDWLQGGLELIDTPGTNDRDAPEQTAAFAAIQYSDAVLVCVSAISPLSRSELALLQDHVLLNEVPRISVVVTFLDQVRPNQRGDVINFIRRRLHDSKIEACVATMLERKDLGEGIDVEVAGPEEIRRLLCRWAVDADHVALASRQIRGLLQQAREMGADDLERRVEISRKDRAALESELGDTRDSLRAKAATASDLRIEYSERCERLSERLEEDLRKHGEEVAEKLGFESRTGQDPARWIEEILPFRLKQELKNATRHVEQKLLSTLAADSRWLENELRRRFGSGDAFKSAEDNLDLSSTTVDSAGPKGDFDDLKRLRSRARLASAVAVAGSYLLLGPLGSIVSVAGGLVSETLIRKKLKEQSGEVSVKVGQITEASFNDARQIIRDHCRKLYANHAIECLRVASEWEQRKTKIIENQLREDRATGKHLEDLEKWTNSFNAILD